MRLTEVVVITTAFRPTTTVGAGEEAKVRLGGGGGGLNTRTHRFINLYDYLYTKIHVVKKRSNQRDGHSPSPTITLYVHVDYAQRQAS